MKPQVRNNIVDKTVSPKTTNDKKFAIDSSDLTLHHLAAIDIPSFQYILDHDSVFSISAAPSTDNTKST